MPGSMPVRSRPTVRFYIMGNSMIYTSECLNRIAIDVSMAHRSSVAYMLTANFVNSSSVCAVRIALPFEVLWSDCCTFFWGKLVFAVSTCLQRGSCCLIRYGVAHVDALPCTLMKTEEHIAGTRVWQSASHSRSHRHPTSFGGCIGEVSDNVTVDADDGKHKYC